VHNLSNIAETGSVSERLAFGAAALPRRK